MLRNSSKFLPENPTVTNSSTTESDEKKISKHIKILDNKWVSVEDWIVAEILSPQVQNKEMISSSNSPYLAGRTNPNCLGKFSS